MNFGSRIKYALALTVLLLGQLAFAVEVAGVKLDDSVRVANKELKLNGAGVRYKAIFKVYVAALYLGEKKTTTPDVIAAPGPKRVSIVMLRDVGSEEFGRGFMGGIHQNTDRAEKVKLTSQMLRFGELFASVPELKKGDVLTTDWVPGVGTLIQLNGKPIVEPLPDVLFYNALLRIWLGDKPVDSGLKQSMLSEKIDSASITAR